MCCVSVRLTLLSTSSRKLEYTKESLLKFKKDLAAREKAERQAKAMGDGFGGFGGFGGGGGDEEEQAQQGEGEERGGIEEAEVSCHWLHKAWVAHPVLVIPAGAGSSRDRPESRAGSSQ